ncbi:YbaN family protein [Aureimonas sp. SK2]|uniref:YbaN family protein n=1 Tax=Aureimonas sp. SK2 TaxID=3015992 RepID=UPI00244492AE|nr:YbaN family protein [Aureimonas sp. SK2]
MIASPSEPGGTVAGGRLRRFAFRVLASVALVLALAGVVLPGLPATPFLLLAAWAAARGSPELAARIETHPRLGPLLANWRERRVVPLRAKCLAGASMAASLAILAVSGAPVPVVAGVGAILLCVSTYLFTRPSR